jgi:hypothetical protein
MLNCSRPTQFSAALTAGAPWIERSRGVRAKAASESHDVLVSGAKRQRHGLDPGALEGFQQTIDAGSMPG